MFQIHNPELGMKHVLNEWLEIITVNKRGCDGQDVTRNPCPHCLPEQTPHRQTNNGSFHFFFQLGMIVQHFAF